MIELLFLLVVVVIASLIDMNLSNDISKMKRESAKRVKACPPHQWSWQDMVDENNQKQGERLACTRCGRFPNYSSRDTEDQ